MNPNVRLATKTVTAIDTAIAADQGNLYRYWLGKVLPHIKDAYRQDDEEHRSHLGASILGNECARAIYYSWRWFSSRKHEGRIIRLFNRGHMEEARMIACLLTIGVDIYQQDANGKQYSISHAGGHIGGSGDGVGYNIPDVEFGQFALLEFKTHGEKSFTSLTNSGVRESKYEHYVQVQTYMRKMGLAQALYLAVNKNTDELYGEIILLNPEFADQALDKGQMIVSLSQPPKKINESAGYFKCRFCNHRPVCHLGKAPEINCRTCVNSVPLQDGNWFCGKYNQILSKEGQLAGCSEHVAIR